ncbi:MAG: replication factor A protein 2 [Alectoria sarmentosa]|nr:MAG: replication factor A protein 2 [Alectoria sarmentosa]
MPPRDAVKIACEGCRHRRRKCIPTSGVKCERCTEKNLICVVSPPTEEQRQARRGSKRRYSDQSKPQVENDPAADFDSLFDQSESECDADPLLTRKVENDSRQTKHFVSKIVTDRQRTATSTGHRPTQSTITSFEVQARYESDASDAPLSKKRRRVTYPSQRIFEQPTAPAPLQSTTSAIRDVSAANGQAWGRNQSTSETLARTSSRSPQYQLENTKMKVYLAGSKGFRPLLLQDCMSPSLFFPKVLETWSLLDDSVQRLHVTFPWLPQDNDGRLMILERQDAKAGLVYICDEVEVAPCWAEEKGRCAIDVTIISNMRTPRDAFAGPTTRDGRSIPDMSVDANRVYWAMRANKQADVGLHVQRIGKLVGMKPADVAVAGNELLEHCLILTSDDDYDVWSLLEF